MGLKCPKCQHENPVDTLYCGKCGAKFEAETDRTETIKSHRVDKPIAGKYQVLAELGRGGMGIVYKAKDTKLDRIVALKFLPPGLANDRETKKRFVQEAKAASGLDHANICTIYEIGDTEDGQMFIAMPFYNGESLKEKISQKPLELEETVSIATQISEGLSRAHKKGIVHRDIKPANIMIAEEGVVKIVDFGIAKLGGEAGLTQTGSTVGTTAYMSPEQTRGEKVDSRSDIWSLGVVLYEMLTGQLPFRGEQIQSMIYSILNKDPEAVTSAGQEVPRHIEHVIMKALEKDLEKRFQTVDELKRELQISHSAPVPEPKKSIAVLPFVNMSNDPEQEYFSDGLTEEIITDLSHIHDLLVISRSSAMTFKGSKKKITVIAGEVHVRYVLEGSVRKAGNNLRITAQLIDAEKDIHLWAEKYSGTLDDVFDIQERVSRSIAEALKIQLTPEEKHEINTHPLTDMKAYDCYLRAKQEYLHYTEESLEKAVALIQDGLRSVGENELLYSLLGQIYWSFVNVGIRLDAVWLDRAEECVQKIFALVKESPLGYFLLGLIDYKRGDTQASVRHTKRALEKSPTHSDAIDHLLWMYADAGRTEASEPYIERILEIDPYTPHNHWVIGWTRITQGDFKAGLPYFEKTYTMDPGNPIWRLLYAHQLYLIGKMEEGDTVVSKMGRETPGEMLTSIALLLKHTFRGEREEALSAITDDILLFGKWDELVSWMLAQAYALLDEKEEALRWLEHAVDRGFINYPFLNEYDPFLENIRGEERFKTLMTRVKQEWENFEV